MTIISLPECPLCEAMKKEYPEDRVVNADKLMSGEYKGDDRLKLCVALQMNNGAVPVRV